MKNKVKKRKKNLFGQNIDGIRTKINHINFTCT